MSLFFRQTGHDLQVALLKFIDQVSAPASTGDPTLVRLDNKVYLQDSAGVLWPLVSGADNAGVVTISATDSPYDVQATDRYLLVDTSAGAVQVNLPADGGHGVNPLQFIDANRSFASHALTINGNGHNVNGASTLVVSQQDACPLLFWGTSTWETAPGTIGATSVKVITSADSPYQVLSTDQVLLVDTTSGAVTLTLEASPSTTRGSLTIVDAKRQFATHNVTVDGNGNNINIGSTLLLSKQDGGVILYWNGSTAWELNIVQGVANSSISGLAITTPFMRMLSSLGNNGAGAVALSGTKVGDLVVGVVNITDHTSLVPGTDFESTISVNNQIQQSSATNLSAKTLVYLLVAKS